MVMRGANSPKSIQMVSAHLKDLEVLELRAQGKTYAQISKELGISVEMVKYRMLKSVAQLKKRREDLVEEYIATQLERLRMATAAIMERVNDGDLASIDVLLRVEARTSKLLGLDAPSKWPTDESGRPMAPGNIVVDFDALSDTQLESLRLLGLDKPKGDVIDVTDVELIQDGT